jgi:hypothetical protein
MFYRATYIIVLTLLICCRTLLAENLTSSPASSAIPMTTQNPNNTVRTITNPDGTQVILQTIFCPLPSQLVKNGLYWATPTGNWKSYSESFDATVTTFVGAQWIGINVGKMVCIYKGNLAMSFPITLQNDTLTQIPTGGNWGTDQGGFRNCHSTNTTDCPFITRVSAKNMQQIYQSLDFFKGKPDPLKQSN